MNVYDSQKIVDLLRQKYAIRVTNDATKADLLLMNTCSVRDKAEAKVYSELGRWRILKEQRQHIIIGVTGCIASQEGEAIRQRAPYVDLIVGPQNIHQLPELIDNLLLTAKPQIEISFKAIEKFDNLPEPTTAGPTALVSIMEGCNKYCSYCIVPYTRGKEVSRNFNDILVECYKLSQQGVKEITLLGQNVNAYRSTHNDVTMDLAGLLLHLAELPKLQRLRFMTSNPTEFSRSLFYAYRDIKKLANHLHLPMQSGSDRILTLMKRGYKITEYKEIINQLRIIRPDISITSDFIVGFPGETDEDFYQTMAIVKELNIDQSFSFIYSQRPGTPASNYPNQIPLTVKKNRLKELQTLLNANALQFNQLMLNKTYPILVTETGSEPGAMVGRTENNRVVIINGDVGLLGKIVLVHIEDVSRHSLRGKTVD